MINILSKETIDKIAAGEVAERPESVVKELLDNSIDSGADTVSIEIRTGGLDLIRVTDNGCGIEKDDVRRAFLRHATSKLKTADDIEHIRSMGFRGEALASIAAVSEVELITRNVNELTGTQYRIDGGIEKSFKDIGVPQGTTVIVRNFLLNVPVRRQFLKSPQTEASYIINTVEKLALAYTGIAFSLQVDGKNTFSSTGNDRLKDVIYQIYGRETAASLLELDSDLYSASDAGSDAASDGRAGSSDAGTDKGIKSNSSEYKNSEYKNKDKGLNGIHITGYAARPVIARSRRDYEIFFVNGRWIQSDILRKAAEDAYAPYMMQHKYPMLVLHVDLEPESVDVNVHPRKREVRFSSNQQIYDAVYNCISRTLHDAELIVNAGNSYFLKDNKNKPAAGSGRAPEAFETRRQQQYVSGINKEIEKNTAQDKAFVQQSFGFNETIGNTNNTADNAGTADTHLSDTPCADARSAAAEYNNAAEYRKEAENKAAAGAKESHSERIFINKANVPYFRMVGQVFETYWIIEFNNEMYIIDQHAAHEKVNFENYMARIRSHTLESQMIFPPIVLTLSAREAVLLDKFADKFTELGYQIEYAGDRDYIVRAVPSNIPQLADEDVLRSLIDGLFEEGHGLNSDLIYDKIASMSCKAAIKGNMKISEAEMKELIGKLLMLENPYACPHGRPTIIKWSRTDLDKLFKRIVN